MPDTAFSHLTWHEARAAAQENRLVIVPAGATEAHGPHLPLDVDTHLATTVAESLAARVGALVTPALPYGYSRMWMGFPGTITLTTRTFQTVLEEVCRCLIEQGFHRLLILNGHRPNGTACDVAARSVVDQYSQDVPVQVTVVNYWEPAREELHALRRSAVGGMGHACELETSVCLATRPELVWMDRLEGVEALLIRWDAVAPGEPSRTYQRWPTAAEGHPAIFGDPHAATAESGAAFLGAIVDGLARMLRDIDEGGGTYSARG